MKKRIFAIAIASAITWSASRFLVADANISKDVVPGYCCDK